MAFSSLFLLTFTMEGESELRAGDAFIAKWLIFKVLNLKIRPQVHHIQYAEPHAVLECLFFMLVTTMTVQQSPSTLV